MTVVGVGLCVTVGVVGVGVGVVGVGVGGGDVRVGPVVGVADLLTVADGDGEGRGT
nr:hypothetical protein GCM10020093_076730 [Planobispora longispora]